jgi:phospholipid/cholesterol/gamma-HCH transport system substrate-binding protein
MATKAQKIRVGLFVVVTATLVGLVLIVFGGLKFWKHHDHYKVVVSDSVYGLESGSKVYYQGIRVGSVTDIALAKQPGAVEVAIEVDTGTPIHTDTHALLQYAGITGLREIDLRGGSPEAPMLAAGGTIPQGETPLDELQRRARAIGERSEELMQRAQQLVDNLVTISDPKAYQAFLDDARSTAHNLADASATLRKMVADNRGALQESVAAVEATAKSASEVLDGQITPLFANAGDVVAQAKAILRDNGGSLHAAVADLRQASKNLKDLAREVRQKPSRLLFSNAAGDRKLPR